MSDPKETLYRNWIKAGVGLLHARTGLQDFVKDEIHKFHSAIYKRASQKLPPNSWCNACTIQNVLKCPTSGTCESPRCHFHDDTDPAKCYRPCPQKICEAIRDEVVSVHRYHKPTFDNSDAQAWYTTSWELAKCFMPPGYSNSSTADDTDFPGLINIMLSHLAFQALFSEDLSQHGNIFEKARDATTKIMYNPKMEISTTDLNSYFQILMDILSDEKHLQNLPKAKEALWELQQLKQNMKSVTTSDEEKVWKESLALLRKLKDEAAEAVDKKRTEGIDDIERKTAEDIQDIERNKFEGAQHIDTKIQGGVEHIQAQTDGGAKSIDKKTEKGAKHIALRTQEGAKVIVRKKEEGSHHIDRKTEEGFKSIERKIDEGVKHIDTKTEEHISHIDKQAEEEAKTIDMRTEEVIKIIQKKKEEEAKYIKLKTEEGIAVIYRRTEKGTKSIARETEEMEKCINRKKEEGAKRIDNIKDEGTKRIDVKIKEGIKYIDKKTKEMVKHIDTKTEEGANHIETGVEDGVKCIAQRAEESLKNVDALTKELVKRINIKTEQGLKYLNKKREESDKQIQIKTEEGVENIGQTTKEGTELIKQRREEAVEGINKEVEILYSRMPQKVDSRVRAPGYKKNLQTEIIDHYMQNYYCKSSMPALIDDEEVDVADLFLMPKLRIFEPSHAKAGECGGNGDSITTISGLFCKEGQYTRKVCISGDAGVGKTMLCQRIVSYWCKLHANEETEKLPVCDQNFLKSFDFLFYIPLRNYTTSDVIEMIKTEIVRRHMHAVLDEVLDSDSQTCLIILDGLDEWLPPEGCKRKKPFLGKKKEATVLITSRSWKLVVLRPETRDIGHEVELCGFTEDLLVECVMDVVEILNERHGESKRPWDIVPSRQYNKVKNLMQIPIMLTQIVCMWYDEFDVGETRFEVYCRMFEYLLQLADKRHLEKNGEDLNWLEPKTTENQCLLNIFKGLSFCENYSNLLYKLSDLAFHALFCAKKEMSLVFPQSYARIYGLNEEEIAFCRKTGLLSQAKFYTKATLHSKKLSFTHKTFQELLAAIFIASGEDQSFIEMLQKIVSIEDVFEMSQVMLCIAGLRPNMVYYMSQHIAALSNTDERVVISGTAENDENFGRGSLVTEIQRLILDLVEEGYNNGKEAHPAELHEIISSWIPENADGTVDDALQKLFKNKKWNEMMPSWEIEERRSKGSWQRVLNLVRLYTDAFIRSLTS